MTTKLCKRGKDAAKKKFKVYPSAYANGYAVQVCQGKKPDLNGKYKNDYSGKKPPKDSELKRWYKEKWVNVCKKDKNGNYKSCGRKLSSLKPKDYPYCRPLKRVSKNTPKTVGELSPSEIKRRCSKKKSKKQGVGGKPVYLRSKRVSSKKKSREKPWISVETARKFEKYAKERGVSKVARGEVNSSQSESGFFEMYKRYKGDKNKLSQLKIKKGSEQNWRQRRNNFCSRHSAQMKKNNRSSIESSGKYKGLPTRQETGMIMWACSNLPESKLKQISKKLN